VDEIVAYWKPLKDQISEWQRQVGKPIVFTEVGWCSQEGAGMAPWDYYRNQKASAAGLEEQRRLYEAFLQVWDGSPGVGGILWWEWSVPAGPSDFGYSPKDKPAEQVLRQWFAKYRPDARVPAGSEAPADSP
jgi:hypothetical protein